MTKQRKRARNATPPNSNVGGDGVISSSCDICDHAVNAGCFLQCNACSGVGNYLV